MSRKNEIACEVPSLSDEVIIENHPDLAKLRHQGARSPILGRDEYRSSVQGLPQGVRTYRTYGERTPIQSYAKQVSRSRRSPLERFLHSGAFLTWVAKTALGYTLIMLSLLFYLLGNKESKTYTPIDTAQTQQVIKKISSKYFKNPFRGTTEPRRSPAAAKKSPPRKQARPRSK